MSPSRRRAIGAVRGLASVHTLRVLHAAALSAARCAAGPRTRRDVMIAPPLTTAHYARPRGTRITRAARCLPMVAPHCPWRLATRPAR